MEALGTSDAVEVVEEDGHDESDDEELSYFDEAENVSIRRNPRRRNVRATDKEAREEKAAAATTMAMTGTTVAAATGPLVAESAVDVAGHPGGSPPEITELPAVAATTTTAATRALVLESAADHLGASLSEIAELPAVAVTTMAAVVSLNHSFSPQREGTQGVKSFMSLLDNNVTAYTAEMDITEEERFSMPNSLYPSTQASMIHFVDKHFLR
jgi:hypothetical protein